MCEICDEYGSARPDEWASRDERLGRPYDWYIDSVQLGKSEELRERIADDELHTALMRRAQRRDDARPDRMLGIVIALLGIIAVASVLAACGAVK